MDEQEVKVIERLFEKQTEQFQRYLGVVEENFQNNHSFSYFSLRLCGLSEAGERADDLYFLALRYGNEIGTKIAPAVVIQSPRENEYI
jgi:hypothetical protein